MKSVRSFDSHSPEETESIGRMLAKLLPATGTVLLIGELGAGKTALTKGILEGRGLARPEDVASPTFTLIHEYGEPVGAYHIDLYRLDNADEARRVGLEDLFDEPALVLLEWGDRFPELLPADRIEIRLQHKGENSRHIEVFTIA
jgi:tRNA threonylcarbamoyladenosine biosynthesis protein TsaE